VTARRSLIKACLNGARSRTDHERVPQAPHELAADALATAHAGAAAVHVHARRADGSETLEPTESDAAVSAIRAVCPGLPVGLTTGAWIEPDLERRTAAIAGWRAKPDFASVNFSEQGAAEVAHVLAGAGIGIEAGLATLDDVDALSASGLAPRCLRLLVEVAEREPGAAVAAAARISESLRALAPEVPQLHHGVEIATWHVIEAALEAGHDVRIGLEDTLVLEDGSPARDNAELVRLAARLVHHGEPS
jgi:uncharacterized protein (DUF849 family)